MEKINRAETKITIGIIAHVDAGKTTLSEALLSLTGAIRKAGRVDHKDAFLDTHALEKQRGITIFSKPALFSTEHKSFVLLDTPGHTDLSPETERALSVLDYALLIISAADGITGQIRTLKRLLTHYGVPTLIFVNKMDQGDNEKNADLIFEKIRNFFGDGVFRGEELLQRLEDRELQEALAMLEEDLLERYLDGGKISEADVIELLRQAILLPVFFGSALKAEGVDALLSFLDRFAGPPFYPESFSARVYKISHEKDLRLTWIKITGGILHVRDPIGSEKVDGIRRYSGAKTETLSEAGSGEICALSGLKESFAGQLMGAGGGEAPRPLLQPVSTVSVILPKGQDPFQAFASFRQLAEEDPTLTPDYSPDTGEITLGIMGEIQLEILKALIPERFGFRVEFGPPRILYRETITNTVIGMGHFEPLRHYAEVHLMLTPGERGSGVTFDSVCSTDVLPEHFQRLILSQLAEKKHRGVLTGAELTDVRITLLTGRSHLKHTESGDFREAARRAVRQGLMQADSLLLEPMLSFRLEVPLNMTGRAMTDLNAMHAQTEPPLQEEGRTILTGILPAACAGSYGEAVASYTSGEGSFSSVFCGYAPCHNPEEVIGIAAYDPELDSENLPGSVFCSHGAGVYVPWNEVGEHAHIKT